MWRIPDLFLLATRMQTVQRHVLMMLGRGHLTKVGVNFRNVCWECSVGKKPHWWQVIHMFVCRWFRWLIIKVAAPRAQPDTSKDEGWIMQTQHQEYIRTSGNERIQTNIRLKVKYPLTRKCQHTVIKPCLSCLIKNKDSCTDEKAAGVIKNNKSH